MSQLLLATILSALAAVHLACSLKVSLLSNHNAKYFRAVQSLICSPLRRMEGPLGGRRDLREGYQKKYLRDLGIRGSFNEVFKKQLDVLKRLY